MAFREVRVYEIREVLRLWLDGEALRAIERPRRHEPTRAPRPQSHSGGPSCGPAERDDGFIAGVVEAVRPHRSDGHGEAWDLLVANADTVRKWVEGEGLTAVKIHELLARRGVVVPLRTVQRYVRDECGRRRGQGPTVRVNDGEPGDELQVDFGRMGPLGVDGRSKVVWALIFTACYSRHTFVWLSHRQTIDDVIDGFEAAWVFFGGVFATVVPDNMRSIVTTADPLAPRLNEAFVEYAQSRGFHVDPARVRSPKDKPRVERTVQFVRNSMWAGESFIDLADAQRHAEEWCRGRAGGRIHGTTQCPPVELFALEEQPRLKAAPTARYDVPIYTTAKVHRDHHIEVAKALYSVPGNLIGERVDVRADRKLVRISLRGQPVKTHPRQQPGRRVTDAGDLPDGTAVYAMRDIDHLCRIAATHGPAVGDYAAALLDIPLPWTKMRQVYALLGLVKKWGADRVDAACARALDAEAVNVALIGRMLERGTESDDTTTSRAAPPPGGTVITARFARDPEHFAVGTGGGR